MNQKTLSRQEWQKTPYAQSEAKDPDKALRDLLTKRGVQDIQVTETRGPHGRPSYELRFGLKGKVYRIGLETLPVSQAKPDELLKQVKRAVYFLLKSTLEFATVFAPLDQVLFPYLEVDGRTTTYEAAKPFIDQLGPAGFLKALPARQPDPSS